MSVTMTVAMIRDFCFLKPILLLIGEHFLMIGQLFPRQVRC